MDPGALTLTTDGNVPLEAQKWTLSQKVDPVGEISGNLVIFGSCLRFSQVEKGIFPAARLRTKFCLGASVQVTTGGGKRKALSQIDLDCYTSIK